MLGKVLLITISLIFAASEEVSRKGAKAQRKAVKEAAWSSAGFAPLRLCGSNILPQSEELSIDVFQVLDLPLSVNEASLVKSDKGLLLRLALANTSELKMIGLRYSLASVDSRNQLQLLVNRIEGFSIPGYGVKTLTFKTPIKLKQKDDDRLLLMIEQVVSRETIWEVVKAKDALESYAHGDYSVMPTVMRVANQVDARPGEGIRYLLPRRN